jgi:hypothetical protein
VGDGIPRTILESKYFVRSPGTIQSVSVGYVIRRKLRPPANSIKLFLMRLRSAFPAALAMLAASVLPLGASAASVTYSLDLLSGGPGNFKLFAQTSVTTGDNAGLASYNVPLLGTVLTMDNFSPYMQFGLKSSFAGAAGFNMMRSADITTSTSNPVLTGAQDIANASAPNNLVFGIGQTGGSFVTAGWTPVFGGTEGAQVWNAPVLLATGTYTGSLEIDLTRSDFKAANVFTATDQKNTVTAATTFAQTIPLCLSCVSVEDVFYDNVVANNPGLLTHTFPSFLSSPPWFGFLFDSYHPAPGASGSGPLIPATFNPTTHNFSWNTTGSPLGDYVWQVKASGFDNTDTGYIHVRITAVPEPATFTLIGFAAIGALVLRRHRCF